MYANLEEGHGTIYYRNGKKKYAGEFKDYKRHGHGISFSKTTGKKEYEGAWKEDVRHGHGISFNKTTGNKEYEGAW